MYVAMVNLSPLCHFVVALEVKERPINMQNLLYGGVTPSASYCWLTTPIAHYSGGLEI